MKMTQQKDTNFVQVRQQYSIYLGLKMIFVLFLGADMAFSISIFDDFYDGQYFSFLLQIYFSFWVAKMILKIPNKTFYVTTRYPKPGRGHLNLPR